MPSWRPGCSPSSGRNISSNLSTEIFLLSWFGLTAISRGDVSLLDPAAHAPNPQIMLNMATMYASKDLVGLLLNRRIAKTTVVHHICVFMAYLYVLRWIGDVSGF